MPEDKDINIPSSFDLKDLMNMEKNPAIQQQVQQMFQQQMQSHMETPKKEEGELSREDMRKRLREKINGMKSQRMGKEYQEKKQMEQLKNNSAIQQMGKDVDIDLLVNQVMRQQNLPDHPQQRKAVKKQIEKMLEKL
jgi:hypothetical protein